MLDVAPIDVLAILGNEVTPATDLPAVVDVDPSWCEDNVTLHCWQRHADGTVTLWTYTLGAAPGQAQTPPHIIEGV